MAKTSADFKKAIANKSTVSIPSKSILYGVEGVGKTSFVACSKKPFGIMCAGETGLRTLMSNGLIPEINHYSEPFTDWGDLRDFIKAITEDKSLLLGSDSVFIDTVGTAWDLLVDYVVTKFYDGSRKKFVGYGEGFKTSLPFWREFLSDLDKLNKTGIGIWLLGHSVRELFKNPESNDYHTYELHLPESILEVTKRWSDNIFFLNWFTTADENGKGAGGAERYLYAVRRPAFSAKNRIGLDDPNGYKLPDNPLDSWKTFSEVVKKSKANNKFSQKPNPKTKEPKEEPASEEPEKTE